MKIVPRRGRVLIVDDGSRLARELAEILSRENDVTTSGSGRTALQLLMKGLNYDVVFCDVLTPQHDGREFVYTVRRMYSEHAPRLVFMTGGLGERDTRALVGSRPDEVLEPPFEPAAILELVRKRVIRALEFEARERGWA